MNGFLVVFFTLPLFQSVLAAFSLGQYALLNLSGYMNGMLIPFYAATTLGLLHQAWQLKTVDLNNP